MSDSHKAEWKGNKPYFLAVRRYETVTMPDGKRVNLHPTTVIDLDEGGWSKTHADLMRVPGAWFLCSKVKSVETGVLFPVLVLQVEEGDQPFFAAKHIGIMSIGSNTQGPESTVYGIGKKRYNGEVQSMWILPNGSICSGEDVYWIADWMNKGKL